MVDSATQELDHVEGRPVSPMEVFDNSDDRRASHIKDLINGIEEVTTGTAGCEKILQTSAYLDGDIAERPERPWRGEVIASSPENPCLVSVFSNKSPNEFDFADPRFPADGYDRAVTRDGIAMGGAQYIELTVSLQQFHT